MASSGTIIVNVSTASAQLPLEGATVLFTQQAPPGNILGLRITNASGVTSPLTISTADNSYSQSPSPAQQPWTGVNIRIEHPEFQRLLLEGVQIFPGIATIQNASLIPLKALDPNLNGQQEEIFTPQPISEGT